jgi:hypothetical protein
MLTPVGHAEIKATAITPAASALTIELAVHHVACMFGLLDDLTQLNVAVAAHFECDVLPVLRSPRVADAGESASPTALASSWPVPVANTATGAGAGSSLRLRLSRPFGRRSLSFLPSGRPATWAG